MKTWTRIRFGIAALLFSCVLFARSAGVTIITHGLNGNADGWVTGMANQIPNYAIFAGASHTFYKLYFIPVSGGYQLTWARFGGVPPSSTDSGEIIIALDWSQLAAGGDSFNTFQVAGPVASVLQNPNFIPELNGHALCELPLHLIGHSRGGSLMSEVSKILGTNGVWVDQLTTLDPHPLNNDGFTLDAFLYSAVDAPVRTYQNVLFHDNYWQNIDFLIYGEPVSGAYVRELYNLSGGYSSSHSDVHLWYHGTIDERNPASDTEAQLTSTEFSNWYFPYEQSSYNAGFKWSLIGRGDRTSSDRPVGTGYPAIRDGYNQAWDLGAGQSGNRTSLPSNNGNWPNVMKLNLVSTNTVQQGTNISVKYFYQWAKPNTSTASVSFYLDDDLNPLNGNEHFLQQVNVPGNGASFVSSQTLSLLLNATNAPAGHHVVYARITGGGQSRYLYAPEIINVTLPPDVNLPFVSITNPPSAKTYTNSQMVTISANATDNVAVASVEFYDGIALKGTDTSAPYTHDWQFTAADNGTHIWTARAHDTAGNIQTSDPITLTVSIDIAPPSVAIISPTNGAQLTTSSITISGTASDSDSPSSGLNLVEVRVNGGNWSNATGTASWLRSATLVPCANTIEARSRDNTGNYSVIVLNSVTFIPPNTVPNTPSNLSPANGAVGVTLTTPLQTSVFSDLDCIGDTHAASQWQVLNGAGSFIVADSGTDTVNKVTWIIPPNKLYYGSNYQWKVRFQDSRNGWSSYSPQTTFTTTGPLLMGSKQSTNILFHWPTNALGFTLQMNTNLATTNWTSVTPSPVVVNGQYTVTNNVTNQFKFYRLKK